MVSETLAEQLKKVIKEDYGREISVEEARQMLGDLTAYFDLLARLHHQSKLKEPGSSREEDKPGS